MMSWCLLWIDNILDIVRILFSFQENEFTLLCYVFPDMKLPSVFFPINKAYITIYGRIH